jgi:hypothetical protein
MRNKKNNGMSIFGTYGKADVSTRGTGRFRTYLSTMYSAMTRYRGARKTAPMIARAKNRK